MQAAVRAGIVAFALLVVFAAYEAAHNPAGSPEVLRAQLAVSHNMAQQAIDSLGTNHDWTDVSIETAGLNDYALLIHYAARPSKPEAVAIDTELVVSSMLYQLTLASHHASDEHTAITAKALYIDGDRPIVLGSAHYDFAHDTVVSDPIPQ